MPPPKVDTRSKTRRQKEKNRRRKKTLKNRKRVTFTPGQGQSFTDRFKRLFKYHSSQSGKPNAGGGSAKVKLRLRSRPNVAEGGGGAVGTAVVGPKSRRIPKPSMQAIHGVVANAYAARMPVGSEHTKGIYANTETGLGTKNFFKRTLRQMKRVRHPDHDSLPPTYSYQTRPQPIYPHEIQVDPIGLAQPTRSLHNALRPLPAASMPRGHRQNLLREALAQPIGTGLAEPDVPDWGLMYEATEARRPHVTRAMTADELRKEDEYRRVQADMRTGAPGPSMGIWAPSRVRKPENGGTAAVVANGSVSSRESTRRDGRRKLSMVEEHTFLKYYPHEQTDMLAAAKKAGPEGAPARAEIRRMINAVFSNSNLNYNSFSNGSTESYLDDHSPTSSERGFQQIMMAQMTTLTAEEVQRLRNLGLEHMIPAANASQLERQVAIGEIRDVLADFNSSIESESVHSSIHSQHSFDDPLHLSAGEILLLRRQGPEGVEHIRRATTAASAEITMDQVAEAREFLSTALRGARSRSHSRSASRSSGSRGSRRSGSSGSQSTASMLRSLQATHAPATYQSSAAYQALHAAAFPNGESQSSGSSGSSALTESSGSGPLESLGHFSSTGSRSSRSSRRSRRSRSSSTSRRS
uniref:Uncharacterized protein n=1 Tax=viral metagenome TaxID=1070528 RepID=A0A6C0CZW6_9ZZZZ